MMDIGNQASDLNTNNIFSKAINLLGYNQKIKSPWSIAVDYWELRVIMNDCERLSEEKQTIHLYLKVELCYPFYLLLETTYCDNWNCQFYILMTILIDTIKKTIRKIRNSDFSTKPINFII